MLQGKQLDVAHLSDEEKVKLEEGVINAVTALTDAEIRTRLNALFGRELNNLEYAVWLSHVISLRAAILPELEEPEDIDFLRAALEYMILTLATITATESAEGVALLLDCTSDIHEIICDHQSDESYA